jgi:hypothetical protein
VAGAGQVEHDAGDNTIIVLESVDDIVKRPVRRERAGRERVSVVGVELVQQIAQPVRRTGALVDQRLAVVAE